MTFEALNILLEERIQVRRPLGHHGWWLEGPQRQVLRGDQIRFQRSECLYDSGNSSHPLGLDELTAAVDGKQFLNGDKLTLDDVLLCSLVYAAIAKKNFYPVPASIARKYIAFMKYVKKVYSAKH